MIRRPIGCRPNTPEEDAARDTGTYQTFTYREDAAAVTLPGWQTYPQYLGCLDLWIVKARRRSWSSGRVMILRADGTLRSYLEP